MAKTLEIRVLGELEVARGGQLLALPPSKKTRALLGYLAVTQRAHLRDQLCDLLWDGPDDPRAALRWSLSKLRALLDASAFAADRERVGLSSVTTDLDAVRAAVGTDVGQADLEALRAAALCFRGELLEGLALADQYRYHEWCSHERERARALRLELLRELGRRSEHQPEQALAYAREQVSVDPLSESGHVAVMAALGELGRKRDALAQYEICRRMLEQELGSKPSPALLEARMRAASSPGSSARGSSPAPLVPRASAAEPDAGATPFVGRDAELGMIERALGELGGSRRPAVLCLLGEPGLGKSRLLGEIERRVRSRQGLTLSGRAFEAEMVRPFGPFVDALRQVPAASLPDELRARLGPLLPETAVAGGGASDRASLFEAIVASIVHLTARQRPLALLLDDLQWFDEASLALLHYVARALSDAPVLIACGARPGELEDNPAALRLVRTLSRSGALQELELGPLSPEATAALARAVAPDIDVERVLRDSGGNPLFVLELAHALQRGEAPWHTIAGLIAGRLDRLDGESGELLSWAAALGKSFDLERLERVTGMAALDLSTAVAELERRGIVRAGAEGGYDFVHDLLRAGAYQRLSEPRRRVVHRKIAHVLDALDGPDAALANEVAHHAAHGGDAELAARACLAAAERCLKVWAGPEAARLADAGLRHAARLDAEPRLRTEIALLRAHVLSGVWFGNVARIQGELTRAVMEAQDRGMHAEAASGLHAVSILQYEDGDVRGAHESTLRAAHATKGSEPLLRARQLGNTARCLLMLERDVEQAKAMFEEAKALAGDCAPDLAFEWAAGLLSSFLGDTERAVEVMERGLALARASQDRWAEYECLRVLVQFELEAGRPRAACERCSALWEVAAKMGEGSEIPTTRALDALARVCSGDESAHLDFDQAVEGLRDVDAKGILAYVLAGAAARDAEQGRIELAERRANEALRAAEIVNRRSLIALSRSVLARVALARGDGERARSELECLRADLERPFVVSARARRAVDGVWEALAH